jgi:hypothetical protein
MNSRLLIFCHVGNSVFALTQEGTDFRQEFSRLEEALEFAPRLVTDATPVTVFDEDGNSVLESIIMPHAA